MSDLDESLLSGYAPVFPPGGPAGAAAAAGGGAFASVGSLDAPLAGNAVPASPATSRAATVSNNNNNNNSGFRNADGSLPRDVAPPPPSEPMSARLRRCRDACCAADACRCKRCTEWFRSDSFQRVQRVVSFFGSLLIPTYGILLYVTLSPTDQARANFKVSFYLSIIGLGLAGIAAFIALRIEHFHICAAAHQYRELQLKYYFGALLAFFVTVPSLLLQSFGLTSLADVELTDVDVPGSDHTYRVSSRVSTWILFVCKLSFFVYDRVSAIPFDATEVYTDGDEPHYLLGWPKGCSKLLEGWCVWFCHVTLLTSVAVMIVQIPFMHTVFSSMDDTVLVTYPDAFAIPYYVTNGTSTSTATAYYTVTPARNVSQDTDAFLRDTHVQSLDLCALMNASGATTANAPHNALSWPCVSVPITPLLTSYYLPSTAPDTYLNPSSGLPNPPPRVAQSLLCSSHLLNLTLSVRTNAPLYFCVSNGQTPVYGGYVPWDPRNTSAPVPPLGIATSTYYTTQWPTWIALSADPTCSAAYASSTAGPVMLFYGGANSQVNLSAAGSLGGPAMFGSFCTGGVLLALGLLCQHLAIPRLYDSDGSEVRARRSSSDKGHLWGPVLCFCCGFIFLVVVGVMWAVAVGAFARSDLPIDASQSSSGNGNGNGNSGGSSSNGGNSDIPNLPFYRAPSLAGYTKLYSCYNDRVQYGLAWALVALITWPVGAVFASLALACAYHILYVVLAFFVWCCCRMERSDFDLLSPTADSKDAYKKKATKRSGRV